MDILLGWLSIFLWTRPNAYGINGSMSAYNSIYLGGNRLYLPEKIYICRT